jgi:hypothetical protein
MTPRAGVKTTLAMERAFSGFPVPSGNPTFLGPIDPPIARLDLRFHVTPISSVVIFRAPSLHNSLIKLP